MLRVWRAFFARRIHDERGMAEFATALMVLPVLFVLMIGAIEVGFYVQTRMRVENIARDAARQVAAGGGNNNERTAASASTNPVDVDAATKLWDGTKCKLSQCDSRPRIICDYITSDTGVSYRQDKVNLSGETVTCEVKYDYKNLSGGLMNGPLGLGIGGILKDFTIRESARSETGTVG